MYLLLILLLFSCQYFNVQAENSAICFLTAKPKFELVEFAQQLARDGLQYNLDVFIMIDDNTFPILRLNTSSNFRLLRMSSNECIRYGFKNTILRVRARVEL